MVSYAASQAPRPTPKIHIADQCAFEYLDMIAWKSPSADTFIRPYRRPCSPTPSLSCLVLSRFHLCLNSWATHSFCTWVWGFQLHHSKMQPDSWNVSCVQCTLVQKDTYIDFLNWYDISFLTKIYLVLCIFKCCSCTCTRVRVCK